MLKNKLFNSESLLFLIALLSGLCSWWLVADHPAQIETFQNSPPAPTPTLTPWPPVLSYEKTVDKTIAVVGDTLTYNLIITNTGGPTSLTAVADQLEPQVFWTGAITANLGSPFYNSRFELVGWSGSISTDTTLIVSYTVVITNVPPFNGGNVITNEMDVTDYTNGIVEATRFVETIVSTPIPAPTNTPRPTRTFTAIPTSTPLPTDTPLPTNTPIPTGTPLPTPTSTPKPTDTPVASPTVTVNPESNPVRSTPTAEITSTSTPSIADWPNLLPETGER